MRELKFRIWDGKNKEWLGESDKDSLTFYGFSLIGECMTVQSPTKWNLPEGSVVEQYTGLEDKNGKEIYEGDIVTVDSQPYIPGGRPVGFKDGSFVIDKEKTYFIPLYYLRNRGCLKDVEVIGNIHENPELLENKD